jgi:hypothetical protein
MSEFSINDKRKIKEEVSEMAENKEQVVEAPTESGGKIPEITLENIEVYKLAVNGMRDKLVGLVNEGFMTESTATRLMEDFMFRTFNQVVTPKLG